MHGEQDQIDPNKLSEKGRNQVTDLARSRVAIGVRKVYSSPMKASKETAKILANEFEASVDSKDCLTEIVLSKGNIDLETQKEILPLIWQDPGYKPKGGESLKKAQTRFGNCMNAVGARHVGDSIAVVAHPIVSVEDWLYSGTASCSAYEYSKEGWTLVMPPDDSFLSEPTSIVDTLPKGLF
ncbi:MAG: histidine phosphatase family protein [Candidatus Thorarchaeota archaeon]